MDEFIGVDWSLPAQQKPGPNGFDHRPKAVEGWLKNLPVANVNETSRQLYQALDESNRLRIRPAARLELLERLRGPLRYTAEGLRRQYLATEFPLPERQRQTAELVTTLYDHMATGYRIAIQNALRNQGRLGDKRLALAIDRALRYTTSGILESFLIYQPPRTGAWGLAHELYRLAEARNLLDVAVADSELQHHKQGTVNNSYKQLLLLAAAGPHRMRQEELGQLYVLLERWVDQARLSRLDESGDGIFLVDLEGDCAPLPISAHTGDEASRRVLMTGGMLEVMQREIGQRPPRWKFWQKPSPARAHAALVQRAMLALGVVPKRQYTRSQSSSRAEVMVGLATIHRELARQQGLEAAGTTSRFAARDVKAVGEEESESHDVWELIFPGELTEQEEPGKLKRGQRKGDPDQAQHWRLVNISAGGYCLLSDPTQSARIQVGELVAIRELDENRTGYWQTGVVRWMKHASGAGLQVGVQVLAPSPAAVLLSAEQEDGDFGPEERGLLLPEVLPVDQPVTLATPCLHFASGRKTRLKGMGSETTVRLGRQLESTGTFAQFEFRTAAAEEAGADKFKSVWSTSP